MNKSKVSYDAWGVDPKEAMEYIAEYHIRLVTLAECTACGGHVSPVLAVEVLAKWDIPNHLIKCMLAQEMDSYIKRIDPHFDEIKAFIDTEGVQNLKERHIAKLEHSYHLALTQIDLMNVFESIDPNAPQS